jgi:Mce-associated membrane protein
MAVDIDIRAESPTQDGDLDPVALSSAGEYADQSLRDSTESKLSARRALRAAMAVGVISLLALTGICGWFGYQLVQVERGQRQAAQFVQAARQGVLNLTTIGHASAEHDVARVLDATTGGFHDDFESRSQQFIKLVETTQTDTVGVVTAAGLESQEGDKAQVLVAVSVKTSNPGGAEQPPHLWRMRVDVDRVGADVKVSNVQFVL